MGRLTPSVGQPPASFRRAARAKRAKATVNQLIPSLLPTHPRARKGIETAELIVNQSPSGSQSGDLQSHDGPTLRLEVSDTLAAARSLLESATAANARPAANVAILNMASPLNPGGGFLNGASSQEETLCMRTTLLPSLQDQWYRLPELGAIYTPDVLVFRDGETDDDSVLDKKDRWFVNCISAAMLRNPDTERDEIDRGRYDNDKDRQLVVNKMRMVMRVCEAKNIRKVVLGAWGCGAYGNPVGEVAAAWRKVLLPKQPDDKGNKKSKGGNRERWNNVDEVVFAIRDPGMATAFAEAFGDGLEMDQDVEGMGEEDGDEGGNEAPEETSHQSELKEKIRGMEARIEGTANPQLKEGLRSVLAGMVAQLGKA